MRDTQLILVEGMSGAGKSTTAERIAEMLCHAGRSARAYHEFDDDNPIRTRISDAMKRGYEKDGPLEMPDASAEGSANPYGSHQWKSLADGLVKTPDRVVVLESRYWQNSLYARFLTGWSPEKLRSYQRRMCRGAAPAKPTLVYLAYDDPTSVMGRIYPERTPEWLRWMQRNVSETPWCRDRGLSGAEAVEASYRAWARIAETLFEDHEPHRLRLCNPADDWHSAMAEIEGFLVD